MLMEAWGEVKRLVRIRVMDQPDAALLSPKQAYFLRQNLQLRLLGARQALLARDPVRLRSDLQTARSWINRYYDLHAAATRAALASLKEIEAAGGDVKLPNINDSLAAFARFQAVARKGGAVSAADGH